MSSHYRERREAGVYDEDEATREKAGAKFDKTWNAQQEAVKRESEQAQDTTNPPGTAAP